MIGGLEKENMINYFKMKNFFLISIVLLGSILINAQDCLNQSVDNYGSDSVNCRKNLSLYTGYLSQKNFNDAALFWTKTQVKCPQLKPNLYANGAYIYKQIIKQKAKEKAADLALYKDTLYKIYDNWLTNFGECNTTKAALAKDIILIKDQKKFSKSYALYKEVMEKDPSILKSSDIKYFFVYTGMYMLKTGKIECEEFLSNYEVLSTICENNIAKGNKPEKFSNVQNILDKKLGETPCASCDKLEEIYTNKYNNDPENMTLVRKIFGSLSNNKCTSSKLYLSLLDKVLNDPNNPPTAKDLFNAAVADYRRKDFSKAENRFNRAISITEDSDLKQKIYEILFDISFSKKQFKKGFDVASKLNDNCEVNDKKARIIAASSSAHGNSTFDKSLIYCLALKYASNSCGKTPSSAITSWKAQLLPKSELIMLDVASGSTQNVPFWGQSIELKTRD
jgi:tetratricopeptide (TPR) repeat protein